MRIRKGDWVVVQNASSYYDVTRDGSYGVVLIPGKHVHVNFVYISHDTHFRKDYVIEKSYLRKMTKLEKLIHGIDNV